jgi:phenylacetaldehyde dehydrogenase
MTDLDVLSPDTRAFLARPQHLLIDGARVPAADGATLDVHDPATGDRIATASSGGPVDVDRAVAAARRAFEGEWARMTTPERSRAIWRLADLCERHHRTFTELEILDNGMPRQLGEMMAPLAAEFLRYYGGWTTKIEGRTIPASPMGRRPGETLTYTLREPLGVVGAITPWNSPLAMAVLKLAPVLATGCTLVLKPAELTPLSALLLGDLALEAGIPPGVFNVVPGLGETAGAALAAHPGVDKIAFTGSTEVGRAIVRASAGNLKKVSLELGGKSPVVVFPDADLEAVIPGATFAAFFLQGQNCMAGTRLFVHERVHDAVVRGLAAFVQQLPTGPGLDPKNVFGPLISREQRERVLGYVQSAQAEGAELALGGRALERAGWFVEPTIFARTRPDMRVVREEVFGPVLCVQSFGDGDLAAVARAANDTIYGLSGSVWTRDVAIAHRMVRLIDAGQVSINCHAAVDPAIPFGGNRQSGWGREMGGEALDHYLKTKAVTVAL